MPKKHQQRSLLTKPVSSAPSSLSLSRVTSSNDHVPLERTVNGLIRELRRGQGNELRPQNIQTSSSIPPTLRAVLDMPAPPPPPPRHGIRGPSRLRRVPGPPPPRSWLVDSKHSPSSMRKDIQHPAGGRTRVYPQSSSLPGASFPPASSLQHTLLKSMATRWQWHVEYDHEYLAELPIKMKEILLSYVAIYCEEVRQSPLQLLFPNSIHQDERDEVRRLDLSNAIGLWSTVKRIEKELNSTGRNMISPKEVEYCEAPETWDDQPDEVCVPIPSMALSGPRFQNLKHLSLAAEPDIPGSVASWHDLLELASKFRTLTSLSLAHWPQPTYTPNASSGRFKVKATNTNSGPSVIYGGTDFYSAFDNDWREAAGILRTLSRSLYCLKWFDLTGCEEWFPALIWKPEDEDAEFTAPGPDWNGSWRGLEHLILSVGWAPGRSPSVRHRIVPDMLEETGRSDERLDHASERVTQSLSQLSLIRLGPPQASSSDPDMWNVSDERDKYYHRKEVEKYTELWDCARKVAQELRLSRKENGGRWIDVDIGQKEEFGELYTV